MMCTELKRKVALLGYWKECEQFYFLFKKKFEIGYIILKEGFKEYRKKESLPEVVMYGSEKAEEIISQYYIVLCTEQDECNRARWDYIFYKKSQ